MLQLLYTCTNVHILITIIVMVAGIILVASIHFLNLAVTNETINGIIFYANVVSINDSIFLVNDTACLNRSEFSFHLQIWIWVLRHVFTMGRIVMLKCGYNYSFLSISLSLLHQLS